MKQTNKKKGFMKAVGYPVILFGGGGGVQQIQLRTGGGGGGGLEAVAP